MRWLEIMIASATETTITIAVAAESPPMNTNSASSPARSCSGSETTIMSRSTPAPGIRISPAAATGSTNRLMAIR